MHKPETHDFLKGLHRSAGSVKSKKSSTQLCFWTDATFTSVKFCTWMAVRTRANGDPVVFAGFDPCSEKNGEE